MAPVRPAGVFLVVGVSPAQGQDAGDPTIAGKLPILSERRELRRLGEQPRSINLSFRHKRRQILLRNVRKHSLGVVLIDDHAFVHDALLRILGCRGQVLSIWRAEERAAHPAGSTFSSLARGTTCLPVGDR